MNVKAPRKKGGGFGKRKRKLQQQVSKGFKGFKMSNVFKTGIFQYYNIRIYHYYDIEMFQCHKIGRLQDWSAGIFEH